ncbi:IS30 family transposase [Desulfosediminicola ganghwensis]|uniref:IS30 family transposase n=1 Tax=Desulfosediminicola ganghwensis TaxID=2569540 RepID=UPI00142EAF9C|nr:IS30 family transposase [Desulfosediminicola ganghwensis]
MVCPLFASEAISQRIRIDYHDDQQMRISHESIYRWIYLEANSGGQLHRNLRRGRKKRRRQKRYGSGRRFSDRKCITQRPPIVESRQRLGDWEGDTMEGQKSSGLIVTLVERKSRYLVATKLQDKQAARLAKQTTNALSHIPRKARKTLTVDNGTEFAQYKLLEKNACLDVYFAKPHAPWQRGANENTNGLLRQYFPKGSDFRSITEVEIAKAVKRINHRPRKCLNYQTPYEVFWKEVRGALAI